MTTQVIRAKVREILTELHAKRRLTAAAVVELAKPKTSPLHSMIYKDDDGRAAYKHRLDIARGLIARFTIEKTTTHYTMRVPEFVRDPTVGAKAQGYTSVVRLRSDKEAAREVVITEFNRAVSCLSRAKAIAGALGLTKEIEKLQKRLIALADNLQEQQVDAAA